MSGRVDQVLLLGGRLSKMVLGFYIRVESWGNLNECVVKTVIHYKVTSFRTS